MRCSHLPTALPPYRLTALPPYRLTALPPYRLTALPPYRVTALPPYRDAHHRWRAERLEHDTITLGQLLQRCQLLGGRFGIQLEAEPDGLKADRRFLAHAERAPEVQITLRPHRACANWNLQRRRNGTQGHAGAGGQRLEEHVSGAGLEPGAAGGGMQAGLDQRAPRLHSAAHAGTVQTGRGLERHQRLRRVFLVLLLEGSLKLL